MSKHLVLAHLWLLDRPDRIRARLTAEEGQSTAEYALVVLAAAGVAALLMAWASRSNTITHLLNTVLTGVLSKATGS